MKGICEDTWTSERGNEIGKNDPKKMQAYIEKNTMEHFECYLNWQLRKSAHYDNILGSID